MEFEWDEAKDAANRAKHGLAFDQINHFNWSSALITPDDRKDYGEERFILRGFLSRRLHIAVFVLRENRMRLISFRKANKREQRLHERETGT